MSSAAQHENDRLRAQVRAMEDRVRNLTAERPASERDALAAAYARADSVARQFGNTASQPVPGETPSAYRKRLLAPFLPHSPRFKGSRLDGLDASGLNAVEEMVFADAVAAAKSPEAHARGALIPVVTMEGGRPITRFNGDPMAWMQHFMTGAQVCSFNRNPKG
jgi:hypothetical protein